MGAGIRDTMPSYSPTRIRKVAIVGTAATWSA